MTNDPCQNYRCCPGAAHLEGIPACELLARGILAPDGIGEGCQGSVPGCSREWPAWSAIAGGGEAAPGGRPPAKGLVGSSGFMARAESKIAGHLAGKSILLRDPGGRGFEGTITGCAIRDLVLGEHEKNDSGLSIGFEASGIVTVEFLTSEWEATESLLSGCCKGTLHFTFPGAARRDMRQDGWGEGLAGMGFSVQMAAYEFH